MKVTVEVSSSLQKFLQDVKVLELKDEVITAEDLLVYCSIPSDEVGIVIINGEKAYLDCRISDGDHIKLYPPIIAG